MLRAPDVLSDVAKETASGFGSLKAILGVVSAADTNQEVRLRPPA